MSLWKYIKKSLRDGLQTASEITTEYTKAGRLKIDVVGVKKEIEEKFIELGGRLYHSIVKHKKYDVKDDKQMMQIIEQIKELEEELAVLQEQLKKVRDKEDIEPE